MAGELMRPLLLAQEKPWIALFNALFPTRLHRSPRSRLARQPPPAPFGDVPMVSAGDRGMMPAGFHAQKSVAHRVLAGYLLSLVHFPPLQYVFRKCSRAEAATRDSSGQSEPQMR